MERVPMKPTDPNRITIQVPLLVSFSTAPDELHERVGNEKPPTKGSLVDYLKVALCLDIDNESEGQPEGAAFTAATLDWDNAKLIGW